MIDKLLLNYTETYKLFIRACGHITLTIIALYNFKPSVGQIQAHRRRKEYILVKFSIPGQTQGKGRARTTKFGSYTPEKTVLYENLIKINYQQVTNKYFEGPLKITINAYYEPPKSTSKKQRTAMLEGAIKPTKKPDIDNIAKVVLDALNGIAYRDDTQVIELIVNKSYGQLAKVEVTIEEVS